MRTFSESVAKLFMISQTANIPIMMGMKFSPPNSAVKPKSNRGVPVKGSMPTVARNKPISKAIMPRNRSLEEINAAQDRPISASQKYSKLEKRSA